MAWWRAYFPIVAIVFAIYFGILPIFDRLEGSLIIALIVGAVVFGFAKLVERSPVFSGWKIEGYYMIRILALVLVLSLFVLLVRIAL